MFKDGGLRIPRRCKISWRIDSSRVCRRSHEGIEDRDDDGSGSPLGDNDDDDGDENIVGFMVGLSWACA
nr:hypothetical protein BaRGS_015495 [Batillaria attramentaria]